MAARFTLKILQRRAGSINDTAAEFRRCCIIQGIRCCSSSSRPQNKIQTAENDGYINGDQLTPRLARGDIRQLCEKLEEPSKVSQLLNQVLQLPEQQWVKSVDCALHWLSYYDKIDAALELKTLMEKHGIPKGYSTYSALASINAKLNHTENYKILFAEMKRDGLSPRSRHFEPFLEAATQKGDPMGAFRFLDDMREPGIIHMHFKNTDFYTELIRACIGQDSKQLTNKVFETFLEFRKCRDLLSDGMLEVIKQWFDSQMDPKWVTSWSTSSQRFHCRVCEQKLETGEYSAEELEELKHPMFAQLLRGRKVSSQQRIFTTFGNYVDDLGLGDQSSFPGSITRFIETTGRYDVVLDALNITYFGGFLGADKLKTVVSHFLKQNKKVLVVCSDPVSLHTKHKRVASVMEFLKEHCGVFCLVKTGSRNKDHHYDDIYFLSAAMHCGPGTILVSSDMFADHTCNMDLMMRAQFKRWQQHHQFQLQKFVNGNPVFMGVKNFNKHEHVQTTGDTWHFPSSDGSRWLCVKKA